jgi:recombination protein RecT
MNKAIVLTRKMIEEAKSTKELLELGPIADNWIRTYQETSGRSDGTLRYNAEKILFLQTVEASKALQKADKFSLYGAFIELAVSGLTLRDGITYIVPYGKKAQFMVGWKGRLEQTTEIPMVVHCHEPQVVYDCDEFSYEKGMRTKIHYHKPGKNRTKDSKITHVYWVIEFKHGAEAYIMEAIDVLNIRDKYSSSWVQYVKDCQAQKQPIGTTLKKEMTGPNGNWTLEIEPPMWFSDEAQAFKKTIVHRTWKSLPKLPKHKWLDESLAKSAIPKEVVEETTDISTYTGVVDETTGERPAPQQEAQKPHIEDAEFEDTREALPPNSGDEDGF